MQQQVEELFSLLQCDPVCVMDSKLQYKLKTSDNTGANQSVNKTSLVKAVAALKTGRGTEGRRQKRAGEERTKSPSQTSISHSQKLVAILITLHLLVTARIV